MAAPASSPRPHIPAADPAAIRAALPPAELAEFEQEWQLVLDRVKVSFDLEEIRNLLAKWQHYIVAERRDPGVWARLQDKAARIQQAGGDSYATGSIEDMLAMIRRRQAS
ncbi:DUF6247 family protein [Nocardia sp. NPDC059091]|uniref:DUF6247 family protein n=1 Tax=unclassified Nocardia TaxID=2637762 RepID=UPI0036C56350